MNKTGILGTLQRRAGYGMGNSAIKMLNTRVISRGQKGIMGAGMGLTGLSFIGSGLSGLSSMTKSMREAPLVTNSMQPRIGMANMTYNLGADPFAGIRFAGRQRRNI